MAFRFTPVHYLAARVRAGRVKRRCRNVANVVAAYSQRRPAVVTVPV